MDMWKVIVYIPAYNSSDSLPELISRLDTINQKLGGSNLIIQKVIIVNDGSFDNTESVLSSLSKKHPFLVPIQRKTNGGPVAAIYVGMEVSLKHIENPEKTILVRMDSDLEHLPEDIEKMIKPISTGEYSLSIGCIPYDMRYGRLAVWFNNYAGLEQSREFLGLDIPQFCPGFIAVRGDLFIDLFSDLTKKIKTSKEKYGDDLLAIDFLMVVLAKKLGKKLNVIKLSRPEDKWVRVVPIGKIFSYLKYHWKTLFFLRNEL
jgi:glycosyltransferase involved in cell wall biosynthesis